MKKFQFFLLLAAISALTSCKKEQVDGQQASPITTTSNNASDGHGCNGGFCQNNTANTLVADFDLVLDNGAVNEKQYLTITNKSANAVSYEWDFGNGIKAVGAVPTHSYKIHGNYSIKLTAIDAQGNRQTVKKDLTVLCIFGGGTHDE